MKTTHLLLAAALSACLCSCMVDRELDLSKEYEDKMTVIPGLSAPVRAESKLFSIDGILDLAFKGQDAINGFLPLGTFFEYDDEGNFSTPFGHEVYEVTIFPNGTFGSISAFGNQVDTHIDLPSGWSNASFKLASNDVLNFSGSRIGTAIQKVRNIKIKPSKFDISWMILGQPFTKATVRAGSTITLPEWMQVSTSAAGVIAGADGHTLIFTEPMEFSESSFSIPVTLESIRPSNDEYSCTKGSMSFDAGSVSFELNLKFNKTDSSLSDETETDFASCMSISSASIYSKEADCLLAPVIPFSKSSFDLSTGTSSLLSFAFIPTSMMMDVTVTNGMEVPISVTGEFSASDTDGEPIGAPVTIGPESGSVPMEIGAGASSNIRFSDSSAPAGSTRVPVTEINEALQNETFGSASLSDLSFSPASQDWIHVDASKPVTLATAEINALGAFSLSSSLDTQAEVTIGHFGVDTTFTLDSYSPTFLDLVVDSSIPIGIDLRCTFVDKDGVPVPEYAPVVSTSIAPGTFMVPRESVVTIGFQADKIVPFESLRLQLLLNFSQYKAFPLNKAQGLTFKRIVFRAPDGVTVDPDWLEYIKYINAILTLSDGVQKLLN